MRIFKNKIERRHPAERTLEKQQPSAGGLQARRLEFFIIYH